MLPYFFSAGYWNYARYISWHLLEMKNYLAALLRREDVCRHKTGNWNAVFGDQFVEQTYIRYGKAKGGLVGKLLLADQTTEWIVSQPLCNMMSCSMTMSAKKTLMEQNTKKKAQNRMQLDTSDRTIIMTELMKHIHIIKYIYRLVY